MAAKRQTKNRGNRGLIQHSGILPNSEREVALLMQEGPDEKRERAEICRRIAVQSVAAVKAALQRKRLDGSAGSAELPNAELPRAKAAEAVYDDLRRTFAEMIDGSRFRAAWDLGDAPPMRIMATVAKMAINELADSALQGHHEVTQEALERDAVLLLLEVEQRHGVTHVAPPPDPRQGSLPGVES